MYDPYAEFKKHALPNGLEVHIAHWPNRPWIKAKIVVHSASREDPAHLPGLAHFVEHVINQNIPGMTPIDVLEFFEACGGSCTLGTTSYLSTRYAFCVPTEIETLQRALGIIGSMLVTAKLDNNIEHERKIIHREYMKKYSQSKQLEKVRNIRQALFGGHRLESWNSAIGLPEGFLAATQADLQAFYDQHFTPSNISMVVISGLPVETILREIEKSPFGIEKSGIRTPVKESLASIPVPTSNRKMMTLAEQSQAEYLAVWAFPTHFTDQTRGVFFDLMEKILFDEMREKRRLVYGINSSFGDMQDIGEYAIECAADPESMPEIENTIQELIASIPARRGVFEKKLVSFKKGCVMSDCSASRTASYVASDLERTQRIITLEEIRENLEKVTFDQVVEAAWHLRPEQQHTTITRP